MAVPKDIDLEILSKLYRESGIVKCKRNDIKKKYGKESQSPYCQEKNIPEMDHKTLSHKYL